MVSQLFAIKDGHFFGNFILKTGTLRAMNVEGTAVRRSGLAGSLKCKVVFTNTKFLSAVFLDCHLVDILRPSSLIPERAQRNRTRSLDFKSRVSYSMFTFSESCIVIRTCSKKDQKNAHFS
jgi:hypothetical protein